MVAFTPERRKHISESMKRWYQNANPELVAQHKAKRAEARTKWKWTEKEINMLRERYPTISARELSYIFNKPIGSIRTKAHHLGIKAMRRPSVLKGQKIHSDEWKAKLAQRMSGDANPAKRVEVRSKISHNASHPRSEAGRLAIRQAAQDPQRRAKISQSQKGREGTWARKEMPPDIREKIRRMSKMRERSQEERQKLSLAGKKRIVAGIGSNFAVLNMEPGFIAKRIKGLRKRPTTPERRLMDIIGKYFPEEWQYTGDGKVILHTLNPDFINSKKKLIEVFGRVWHDPNKTFKQNLPLRSQEPYRKALYASFGFDCLVLWDDEMVKLSDEEIATTIRKFTKSRHKPTAQLPLV